jgi:hypothetical protein
MLSSQYENSYYKNKMDWLWIGLGALAIVLFIASNYAKIKVSDGKGCSSCPGKNIQSDL